MRHNHTQSLSVAVIFEVHAQKQLEDLAKLMPVWVIQSSENDMVVANLRENLSTALTVFFGRENEPKQDMCARIIYDVDDHHAFNQLFIYGATPMDIGSEVVSVLKLTQIEPTSYGSYASR
jgi:hypothetical protein